MKIISLKKFLKKIFFKKKICDNKVLKIINKVYNFGDKALLKFSNKYDGIKKKNLILNIKNINTKFLKKSIKKSIKNLKNRIFIYHLEQKKKTVFKNWFFKDKYFDILGQKISTINKIGIYVPGGRTIYPSSLLMSAVPAIIAGVKKIYIISPIKNVENYLPLIYTAKILNIKKIYRIGGAHAIAAFALGTETIKPVDKIVGPGNYYVSNAKKTLFGNVGIDMYAGPTELMILCDKNSITKYIVFDSLAQMEHDPKSKVIIISNNILKLIKIIKTLKKKSIKENMLYSYKNINFVYIKNLKKMFVAVNKYAPEHLEIFIKNSNKYLNYIRNSGSVFLGNKTTECLGDYAAGCNHILPTNFCSRFSSPLGVNDFLKFTNVTKVKIKKKIFNICYKIANIEKLKLHAKSLKIRLNEIK
ncbi:histidinol dehydrogenase [Candidatus Vidania fulgoroideae]|nr:histidinol dehydrogenase [Candidatus Vidania fulgoroideae]